jgi:Ulp1 family protease
MSLCSHHWILAIICLKEGNIFILDPLDVDESIYKEFINCIQKVNNISTVCSSQILL